VTDVDPYAPTPTAPPQPAPVDTAAVLGGSATQVIVYANDHPEHAGDLLDAEQEGKARATLVPHLERIYNEYHDRQDPTGATRVATLVEAGTVDDVLGFVGLYPDSAQAALDAEQAKDEPRSTLVRRLEAVLGGDSEGE
jgi:hypothetical protein